MFTEAYPRLRGRKAVEQRLRRLAQEPRCRHCLAKGRITAATVPDHIIPLSKGGTDDDDNIQCLCDDCHDAKTTLDNGYKPRPRIGIDGWPIEKDRERGGRILQTVRAETGAITQKAEQRPPFKNSKGNDP